MSLTRESSFRGQPPAQKTARPVPLPEVLFLVHQNNSHCEILRKSNLEPGIVIRRSLEAWSCGGSVLAPISSPKTIPGHIQCHLRCQRLLTKSKNPPSPTSPQPLGSFSLLGDRDPQIPVRCFSCGKVIGNLWEPYLRLLSDEGGRKTERRGGPQKIVITTSELLTTCG